MTHFSDQIISGSSRLNFHVSAEQAAQMEVYAQTLLTWNRKINLTAITDPLQIAEKHFIDSVAACSSVRNCQTLMDLGSGGGFPGIVLKIMMPDLKIQLVDSVLKKINFLKHVIRTLRLEKIDAIHARAEDLKTDSCHAGQYDGVP